MITREAVVSLREMELVTRSCRIRLSFLIVSSHSFSIASETAPVCEGKLQAFERPYFHDERATIHTLLRGTSRSLHMRANLVSPSFARCLTTHVFMHFHWLLLDSHSRIYAGENHVENTRKSAIFAPRSKEKYSRYRNTGLEFS